MTDQISQGIATPGDNPAANLIRGKLAAIYGEEPEVIEEEKEIANSGTHSKHQLYMAELMANGMSLPDIQVAWHKYYQELPDQEKHAVWKEFYEQHDKPQNAGTTNVEASAPESVISKNIDISKDPKSMADLQKKILSKVNAGGKLKTSHHIKSFIFSMALASFVTGLLFFITNNEKFIAPFISPSKTIAAAPLITDGSAVGPEFKVIIPKLNLEANIVDEQFDASDDAATWDMLEKGVVLYPNTGKPGEKGSNPVFFGHSSNNIFNSGAAKFVFVRLHELKEGDTYAINYGSKQYVYKIFARYIVKPDQVQFLTDLPRESMSTLITCDPPGTANNRLILQAEQISPDPNVNIASTAVADTQESTAVTIPSNSKSLLSRLFGF